MTIWAVLLGFFVVAYFFPSYSVSAQWREKGPKEACASVLPLWKTDVCALDSWSIQKWRWYTILSDRKDNSRVKVTYRRCSNDSTNECRPLGSAVERVLVPRETVNAICSNRGSVEILLCEVFGSTVQNCEGWTDWRAVRGKRDTFYARATAEDINRCLNVGAKLEERDEVGSTPLHKAVLSKNVNAVRALLAAGANLESRWEENNRGTALHLAAGAGYTEIVRLLVADGARLEALDEFGNTPLHRAASAARFSGTDKVSRVARANSVEVIKTLITAGVNIKSRNQFGDTPLHLVVQNSEGIEREEDGDYNEETAYITKVIHALIEAGADLEAQDKNGGTPLHDAATNNIFEDAVSIKGLISAGAKIDARDKTGNTPLHKAAAFNAHKSRKVRICKPAVERPFSENCSTKMRPRAAIHVRNATATVLTLLNAGADATAQTKNGKKPIELIKKDSPLKGTEAYKRLKEAGSK